MGEDLSDLVRRTGGIHGELDIQFVEVTPDRVVLTLEVGPRVHQPFGLLHGGISALLAESAASVGATACVWPAEVAVGTELNCSHLRSMRAGTLTATARPLRKGRRVHVWAIDLSDDDGNLICAARCSLQILPATTTS